MDSHNWTNASSDQKKWNDAPFTKPAAKQPDIKWDFPISNIDEQSAIPPPLATPVAGNWEKWKEAQFAKPAAKQPDIKWDSPNSEINESGDKLYFSANEVVDDDPMFEGVSVNESILNTEPVLVERDSVHAAEDEFDFPPESNPTLSRDAITEGNSNQKLGDTCSYHGNAKVIMHNMFLFLVPKKVDDRKNYMKNQCNMFLNTTTVSDNISVLDKLTPGKCSAVGYDKILLFLYIYFLYAQFIPGCGASVHKIRQQIYDMVIPDIFEGNKHLPHLQTLLTEIHAKISGYTWYTFACRLKGHDVDLIFNIIRKITSLNFYVCLGIQQHRLTIIGTSGPNYIIKNSWGKPSNIVHKDLTNFRLPGLTEDAIGDSIDLYLPIPIGSDIFKAFIREDNPQDTFNFIEDLMHRESDISLIAFNKELNEYAKIIRSIRGGRKTRRFKRTKRIRVRSKNSKKHRK